MPEGVEVSYLASILSKSLEGHTLKSIEWISGRYVHHGLPKNTEAFTKALPLKCTHIQNKGKVLFFYFEQDWCLISKLGMTGWWFIDHDKPTWHKAEIDVRFYFNDHHLNYTDFRNFGTFTLTQDKAILQKEVSQLAPDILQPSTNYRVFQQQISQISPKRQKWLIEDALLDQQFIVSGIGNYLKSEILYEARISPLRPLESITTTEWKRFFQASKKITKRMLKSIRLKDDEVYINSMKVYQKETDPEGRPVLKHTTKQGRTTFYVPSVQK